MKPGGKPIIFVSILLILSLALLIIIYVGIKLKYDGSKKDKIMIEEKLSIVQNQKVKLIAVSQFLSARERIDSIAISELGMIRRTEPSFSIDVNKSEIDRIDNYIKEKYE